MPKPYFEELDFRPTELGDLSLRRRNILALDNKEVFEITLGNAFLMSSLFTVVEEELSHLGLAAVETAEDTQLDVAVGGLGLGYTAAAALENSAISSLFVVEYLLPVIDWHKSELLPVAKILNSDPRCQYVHGDFFDLAVHQQQGFDPHDANRKFHAVLLDIDHSPDNLLHEQNSNFYQADGLRKLKSKIHKGGVFALWSDDPPEENFTKALDEVFDSYCSHVVEFFNPLQNKQSASTVYVAKKSR